MHLEVATVEESVALQEADGGVRWQVAGGGATGACEVGWFREQDMAAVGLTTNMRKVLSAANKSAGASTGARKKRRRD